MQILEWQWDDGNLDELAAHGIRRYIVQDVAEERPKFRRNKTGRAASHLMIGPDRGGALWVICIGAVPGQPGVWRAITGWRADDEDKAWYAHRSRQ